MPLRIVVAGCVTDRRARFVEALARGTRDVVAVDLDQIEVEVRDRAVDVVVLDLPASGAVELIRAVRAADASGSMYVISVIDDGFAPRTYTSAIAAGSHDVIGALTTDEELCARVDVHRRLRGWSIRRAPALQPVMPAAITELRAWDYLGDVAGDDLEAMLGQPLRIEERWLPSTASLQIATIAMSWPSQRLDVCISVAADDRTRRWLGRVLLGDDAATQDSLDDLMREMANVAAGALKRAVLSEGPVLTTGIPVDGGSLPTQQGGARCWMVRADDHAIGIIAEVRHRANRRIPARRLQEGMVVVCDVRNGAGILLLPSGTRLTSTTAERLSALLDNLMIDVMAS